MVRCTVCGRENEISFRFCLDCGTALEAPPSSPPAPSKSPDGDDLGAAPLQLTEEAPPTGMMPMQSAATAAAPPSVRSATPSPSPGTEPPVAVAPGPPPSPYPPEDPDNAPTYASQGVAPEPIVAPGPPAPPQPAGHARPCPVCTHEVEGGHAFCGSCGSRVDGPAPAPSTAPIASTGGTMVMGAVDAPELVVPRFIVTVVNPDGSEARSVSLTGPESSAGDASATVPIPDDPFVDRVHLKLIEQSGVLRVQDAGSETGTFLKIPAHEAVPLPTGSSLRFGRQRMRLERLPPCTEASAEIWGSPDEGLMYRLVEELQGGGEGRAFTLGEGTLTLGRDQGELTFPEDGYVSGTHALIKVSADGRVSFEDLGSSNGSFLGLSSETVLSAGDFLLVGVHLLRIDLT